MSAIIFDTETTGVDEPVIVEAAMLHLTDEFSLVAGPEWAGRFNPGKRISLGAMATHHILDEDVADAPPASTFSLPRGTEYLIGHNVDFDWRAIGEPPVKRICTLALCRDLWPEADSHTQSAMLYLIDRFAARELLRDAHSALADVRVCFRILVAIVQKLGRVESWESLWRRSEQARIPKTMPFGKHKGTRISDVPIDYRQWMLRQPDVDQYLRQALTGASA